MKWFVGCLVAVLVLPFLATTGAYASTSDFRFSSFSADYYLGSDSEGRSTLKTVEKFVAKFPNYDQNHGIERAIPRDYDGHTTSLKIASVTDDNGSKLHYETYDSNGNLVLRIGDADRYVHGAQTYVITYTQRDVTAYYKDAGVNEFYWDTNGLEWSQPFDSVTATVHLSDSIKPTFTKKISCYKGAAGSTESCDIATDGTVVTAHAANLHANENMTIALGFTAGTFHGYEPSLWDKIFSIWVIVLVISSIIGFISIFWLSYRYYWYSNRSSELRPIPVEYIPPKATSVLTSSQIGDNTKATTTAQIIDLAVRHYLTISQTSEKTLFRQAEYELEVVKPLDDLLQEEKDFVQTLFGSTSVGTKLETKTLKNNYTLQSSLYKNTQSLKNLIKGGYGLRAKNPAQTKSFQRIGTVMLILSLVTISPLLLVAAIVAFGCGWTLQPLTDKGLELRRYLAGLKQYIELAEKDRIALLQSPEGAEKVGVAIKDGGDKKLVKLYERVLPYAVLFGQEKQWNKQLALQYANNGVSPDWYVGQSAFNAAVFTSGMNDFSTSMNSYGASTSSSSSGSSGGGSSGGGGGGGGGGGW